MKGNPGGPNYHYQIAVFGVLLIVDWISAFYSVPDPVNRKMGMGPVQSLLCLLLIAQSTADQTDPDLILSQGFVRNGDPEVRLVHLS